MPETHLTVPDPAPTKLDRYGRYTVTAEFCLAKLKRLKAAIAPIIGIAGLQSPSVVLTLPLLVAGKTSIPRLSPFAACQLHCTSAGF